MRARPAWWMAGALALALVLGSCGGGGLGGPFLGSGIEGAGAAGGGLGGGVGPGDSTSVAGGIGSGGTGISGEGVGSGGTGATADAAGIGSVDGFGSIIVNGVRFDIAGARMLLSDVTALRLGMTVRVSGVLDPGLAEGTATVVVSAADLRGAVTNVDAAGGHFRVLTVQVTTDPSTAYGGGLASVADLTAGDLVQVHGLPGTDGQLRATRIERVPALTGTIVSGAIRLLDTRAQTFVIGSQLVRYGGATFDPAAPASSLADGQVVRVRGGVGPGTLDATAVEPWYPVAPAEGKRLTVSGLVNNFSSLQSLRIDGVPVDASAAQVSGGPASALADGARVEAAGTVRSGVLVASRITLRHGTAAGAAAAPPTFSARGSVGAYRSPSSFKVQGQDIDAGRPGVEFVGGTPAQLGPGRKVLVTGSKVVDDLLLADRVEFLN